MSSALLSRPWFRILLSGLAGFAVYGSWAGYANLAHGAEVALRSGLIQGSYSLALTFATTLLMERLYRLLQQLRAAVPLTIVLTGSLLLILPMFIHWLAGTPEILMTVLPGFAIGMVYTSVYVLALARANAGSPTGRRA